MARVQPGDQWGALTVLDTYVEDVTTKRNGITDRVPTRFFEMQCKCGKRFPMAADMYRGKRKLRDCGCGAGEVEEARIKSTYLTISQLARVVKFQKEQDLTLSKAIGTLCLMALDQAEGIAMASTTVLQDPPAAPKPPLTTRKPIREDKGRVQHGESA
jgi:hypothetical protein